MISKQQIKTIHSLRYKKFRDESNLFLGEGPKVVEELLHTFSCTYLAATPSWLDAHSHMLPAGVSAAALTADELRRASLMDTPQQVLAVFRQPEYSVDVNEVAKQQLCLALDDVQNPGNLGTIVRLADWFGIEHIFCSPACADIYNPKTVQATMGGIASVQVHYVDLPQMLASLPTGIPVYGTFLDGDNIYQKTLENRGIILMGNEGKGISPDVEAYVTERLYIPNHPAGRPTSESLNVAIATAIVCAEFRRRT